MNLLAQEEPEQSGIDGAISGALRPISDRLESIVFFSVPIAGTDTPLIVLWLVVAAFAFTVYFGFINIRGFRHGIDLVRGKFDDEESQGDTSHFQALATALSSTVGLGNIAGVAVAISIGGPGAAIWMMICGFFGMSTKFLECTLGVLHRSSSRDGTVNGGPMYYLERGFRERKLGGLGKGLAIFFAIATMGGAIGGANMFQVNQVYTQVVDVSGGDGSFFDDKAWLFGLIMACLVGAVIIGGINSIARVTEKVVPAMGLLFVLSGLIILGFNAGAIPGAIGDMLSGAFTGAGVQGGVIGALIVGFQRAAFSNEAGLGSAAIAHSSVKTREPLTEGFVALLEPFIDTIVICFVTASVIVVTGEYQNGGDEPEGIALTSRAFETVAPWFPVVLAVAVFLFAFSTIISWSYYGVKAWTYLVGDTLVRAKAFQLVFCLFTIVGATLTLDDILGLMDSLLFLMAIPNIIGLYVLAPKIKARLNDYWSNLQAGTLDEYDARSEKAPAID